MQLSLIFASRLDDRMRQLPALLRRKMGAAVEAGAEVIVGAAKKRTPVESGALRDNVDITPYDVTEQRALANIAYTQNYAPYVHERLELKHTVGEAKFLENAMNDSMTRVRMMQVIQKYLEF